MKMTWKFVVASFAMASTAYAADNTGFDLAKIQPDPQSVLDMFAPQHDHGKGRGGKGGGKAGEREMPKACKDANITEDQKGRMEAAAYDSLREKIQLEADLKLAFMDYAKAATDANGDRAAADTAGTAMQDVVKKLGDNHLGLANKILFEIVNPDQRKNTFMCMISMHKMKKGHGKGMH